LAATELGAFPSIERQSHRPNLGARAAERLAELERVHWRCGDEGVAPCSILHRGELEVDDSGEGPADTQADADAGQAQTRCPRRGGGAARIGDEPSGELCRSDDVATMTEVGESLENGARE
jgi:hypothetical protein